MVSDESVQPMWQRLTNEKVKEYFRDRGTFELFYLEELIQKFKSKGYKLDQESGFLIRSYKTSKEQDIIITRPTSIHHHEDVIEIGEVLSGSGELHWFGEADERPESYWNYRYIHPHKITDLTPHPVEKYQNNKFKININEVHAFKPKKIDDHLEIKLTYSEIPSPEKEHCIKQFDKW